MKNSIMKFDLANSLRTNLRDKKFRYGGYATLVTAIVITMLILFNLVVDQFDFMLDLTRNRLFSLSEQTFAVLDELEYEIDIISLNEPGAENLVVMQIIEQYTARNRHINFSTIDPVRHPHMVMRYQKDGTTLSSGSIIVENRDLNRFKVIPARELINIGFDARQQPVAESLAVEQRLTGAIIYVTTEELPVVYVLTGQDQATIPPEIREQMEFENFRIEEINLLTTESVPDDAHALLVISPKRDLTDTEEQRLRDYLERQGRVIFLMDIMPQSLPRFEAIFRSYGVELNRLIVVEQDAQMHVGNPLWLLPNMKAHAVMTPLRTADMRMLIPVSQSISIIDVRRRTLNIEPLLVTSKSALGKTNLEFTTFEREEGDLSGPFNIGVAVTDEIFVDDKTKTTKIILLANAGFLSPEVSRQIPGNANFLLNSLNWIQDREEAISIRPISLAIHRLNMNWQQQIMLAAVAVILIPLLILSSGLFVWMKRRHL